MKPVSTRCLHEALRLINKAVKPISYLPSVNFTRLELPSNGEFQLTATDLDIEVRIASPGFASGKEISTAVLETKPLNDLVAGCYKANKRSSLVVGNDGLITCDGVVATIATHPIEDSIEPQKLDYYQARQRLWFGQSLVRSLSIVNSAITAEGSRFALGGAQFSPADPRTAEWDIAATDSHRIATRRELPCAIEGDQRTPFILPTNLIKAIIKMADGETSIIDIGCHEDRITVGFSTSSGLMVNLTAKTIDGNFPDWKRVMPTTANTSLSFNLPSMVNALARIKPVIGKRTGSSGHGVEITIGEGNRINAYAKAEGQSVSAPIAGSTSFSSGAPDVVLAISFYYLSDMVSAYAGEESIHVSFSVNDKNKCHSAVAFRPLAASATEYVIMPMRTE